MLRSPIRCVLSSSFYSTGTFCLLKLTSLRCHTPCLSALCFWKLVRPLLIPVQFPALCQTCLVFFFFFFYLELARLDSLGFLVSKSALPQVINKNKLASRRRRLSPSCYPWAKMTPEASVKFNLKPFLFWNMFPFNN